MREHTAKSGVIKRPENYVHTPAEQAEMLATAAEIRSHWTHVEEMRRRGLRCNDKGERVDYMPRKFSLKGVSE